MPQLMSRAAILQAQDIGYEDIDLSDIPGWGVVRIKDLTAAERDSLEGSLVKEVRTKAGVRREVKFDNVRAAYCAATICDEALQPVFFRDDVLLLGAKSARALDRIFARVQARNGLSDKDVETLIEDFESAQADASPTG